MKDIELLDISLMEIQIFLKAADCGTFAGAARELNITPGMVSKRIVALENKTGLILFHREGNRVALTPGGRALQKEWDKLIVVAADGIQQAHQVQKVENSMIKFRVNPCNRAEEILMPLIRQFEQQESDFRYQIEMNLSFDFVPLLEMGECDVGFFPAHFQKCLKNNPELGWFCIARSPLYAAISPDNPLAKEAELKIEQLRHLEFVMPQPGEDLCYKQMLLELCEKAQFTPKGGQYAKGNSGFAAYLNLNKNRVLVIDEFYHAFRNPSVVYKPIQDTESGVLIVWRKNGSQTLKRFIRFVKKQYSGK